jgi:hypothetical protein
MPRLRLLLVAFMATAPLAACHPHKSSASSADSHAPGTTTATVAADCSKYPQGAPGVIRTFCDGPAVVKLTVAGIEHTLTGGSCQPAAASFALNLGVVAGPDLAGPKPDYVGLTAPVANGPFNNGVLAIDIDGKGYAIIPNSGSVSSTGGSFAGKAIGAGGPDISGTFTC